MVGRRISETVETVKYLEGEVEVTETVAVEEGPAESERPV
jgi:hypothetical protein